MSSLRGSVICPAVRGQQTEKYSVPFGSQLLRHNLKKSGFCGMVGLSCRRADRKRLRKGDPVLCSFSSSSQGDGNSSETDSEYVNSSVIDAVEVRSGPDGFMIKMGDGRFLRCAPNNTLGGRLQEYAPHPAIVLKMEDGTGIVLPIIVLEMPNVLLMAALRNAPTVRPTVYQVILEMIEKMGYAVKLVRVTKRVHDAYFAELHLVKLGNEAECMSFDLRPSDAINIGVRCKVPIQVNRYLAYSDGMRIVEAPKFTSPSSTSNGLFSELDRPTGQLCIETKEFDLIRNMLIAAVEERYKDAAAWRDRLTKLRSKRNWT